jgi:hypothetical protein
VTLTMFSRGWIDSNFTVLIVNAYVILMLCQVKTVDLLCGDDLAAPERTPFHGPAPVDDLHCWFQI